MIADALSTLFGAGVQYRNSLYDSGKLKVQELRGPVVSIGNLSVGGSGKTPFTILLGQLLKQRGILFDILSRGYGRNTKGTAIVDPNGSPRQFGDEPLLIARKLEAPVILGEDRFQAGLLAEEEFGPRLHLLDDGFQHRRLGRQFDIVLLTPEDLRDRLLPAGRLREPLSSLNRADAIVRIGGVVASSAPAKTTIWKASRGIAPVDVPARPIAFCGIARPQNFFVQLRMAGIQPAGELSFRDHHAYTERDIRDLLRLREASRAHGFVTTEKDAINLAGYRPMLDPLSVVPVTVSMEDPDRAIEVILSTLAARGKPAA